MGIQCPSNSKVNIGLKVLNQRDDGYHNIYTAYQELDFGDSITIEKMILAVQLPPTWIGFQLMKPTFATKPIRH